MDVKLKISLFVFSIILFIITTSILKKGRIPIKYSLLWYFFAIIILLTSVFPNFFSWIASIVGFEVMSNLIIAIFIGLLIFLTMALTIMVAGQNKKTILLIQELSIVKKELEEKSKNK
ncbi:MAG: DUF2304 domain-containing protein [Bacilli bacterium]|nr:DUF2304 domain-containing protein [Bacilli bacterium]